MEKSDLQSIKDLAPSPSYVIHRGMIRRNLSILDSVQIRTGAKILLALKGFAMFSVFPDIKNTLHGVCASSRYEARLGWEEFGREVHSYAPAYSEADLQELLQFCDHIVFNSFTQWKRLGTFVQNAGIPVESGLRINPEHSEGDVALYDPCAPCSRLGIPAAEFEGENLEGISGFHFHTLCEHNADALQRTMVVVEEKFGAYFDRIQWLNLGGGHHITRKDYDIDLLCSEISRIQDTYGLQVYLEPGEALALNTGVLVSTVLDDIENQMNIAILDTSASAHMPDILEMPYRPAIYGAGKPKEKLFTYRLGGLTCLAGDVIGDYSFNEPLKSGDRLVFLDMAHYTMVKNTTFNGIQLPAICLYDEASNSLDIVRQFGYEAYRDRLS